LNSLSIRHEENSNGEKRLLEKVVEKSLEGLHIGKKRSKPMIDQPTMNGRW
jgi:hypothetical protein